jgi:aspartate/methionine/tyrosine aminotransferase/predicted nucleotidyltransferase
MAECSTAAESLIPCLPAEAATRLLAVLSSEPAVEEVWLYGSRAMGRHRQGSDIDLALVAPALQHSDRLRLMEALDELLLPWSIDLALHHELPEPLRQHIARVGRRLHAAPALQSHQDQSRLALLGLSDAMKRITPAPTSAIPQPSTPPAAAHRLAAVLDPVIPVVGELVRRTPGTLSLAQGMVNWGPPPAVAEAVRAALQQPGPALDRYGPTWGDPELRAAAQHKLHTFNQLDLDGSFLLITSGSNMAFQAVVQAICDPGSEVIIPLPYYFNHVMAVQLAGGVAVPVEAGPIPDPEQLAAAITPRTRAIVTVSPNNPSGLVLPPERLQAINRLCEQRGLFHISDEAYDLFVHGAVPHWSPGSLSGSAAHTISLYSLSKGYGMAGWRIGYSAIPTALQPALAKVIDTVQVSPPGITQKAAIAALSSDPAWLSRQLQTLEPRRQQLLAAVAAWQAEGLPLRLWAEPDGAFYGLLVIEGLGLSSDALMERLVLKHRVAAVSGRSFGFEPPGCCALRLSYGMLSESELAEALERLAEGVRRLRQRSEQ